MGNGNNIAETPKTTVSFLKLKRVNMASYGDV
jgi:hypothetical protein